MVKTGVQEKVDGIARAASHHEADLRRAQMIAQAIAQGGRIITANDVREVFQEGYGRPLEIGNAMGSIFASKKIWQCVGRVRSKRPDAHARYVSQWKLREAYKPTPQPFEIGIENGVRFCLKCGKEVCECESKSESNQTT